jgi:micrococcal nuclease
MTDPKYIYDCEIVRIVDGDTVDLVIDLGLSITTLQRCRLFGINAPEVRGPSRDAGKAATAHLTTLIDQSGSIQVATHKDKQGKFGRYLATLLAEDGSDLNAKMITDGHAIEYLP